MNKSMPSELEFKSFLEKSPSTNDCYIRSIKSKKFLCYAKEHGINNIFETTDIGRIEPLYKGLCEESTDRAKAALKYGRNSCRSAVREYVDYLRTKGYATNDIGQSIEKLKKGKSSEISISASKDYNRIQERPSAEYTFSFLNDFICLIGRENFIKYMIEHTLFFSEATVDAAHEIMLARIENERKHHHPFPVRKSNKVEEYYVKDEYGNYIYNQDILGYKGMYLSFDEDGNTKLRQLIKCLTHAKPSQGKSDSNIDFGKISHIWGRAFCPYMYTSLWNVAIVPAYLNDLLDKQDDNKNLKNDLRIVDQVKKIYKCICWEKYNVKEKLTELCVDTKTINDQLRPDLDGFNISDYHIVEIAYNYNSRCRLDVKPSNITPEKEILNTRFKFPIKDKSVLNIFNQTSHQKGITDTLVVRNH